MGQMTRGDIVDEGQKLAGRDDSATLANGWLQRWLDSVAASHDWPLLRTETVVSLSAQQADYGNRQGGISTKILRVLDEIWYYTTDRLSSGRVPIRDSLAPPHERIQPTTVVGPPVSVRVLSGGFGVARLSFNPTPDRTYSLLLPYQNLPAAMSTDADVPWYPNDETMIQAVAFKTHEYFDGKDAPATVAAQQHLAALLTNDRARYGNAPGQNDKIFKDPSVFPRSRR